MSETGNEFLSDIARRVAAIDAQADAEIADIMAGRPFHRRVKSAKAEAGGEPAPVKKPRAKRQPKPKS
jgi:hypothetical protein